MELHPLLDRGDNDPFIEELLNYYKFAKQLTKQVPDSSQLGHMPNQRIAMLACNSASYS